MASQRDPWTILGIAPGAGDEAIREAYLGKVKAHPPDREPEAFERVRDAYEALKDPRSRARRVLDADPLEPLVALLAGRPSGRSHAGIDAWLAVIREPSS